MRIEILKDGEVVKTIIATEEEAERQFPGAWRVSEDQNELSPVDRGVPSSCTPAQGLVALYALKSITEDDIKDAIAAITDSASRYTASIGLSRATEWRRDSPTMHQLAQLLSLSDSDLDELFLYAATVSL